MTVEATKQEQHAQTGDENRSVHTFDELVHDTLLKRYGDVPDIPASAELQQ